MANEKLIVELDLQLSNLNKKFDDLDNKLKKEGKKSGESFTSGFSGALSSFAGNLGAIAVAKGIDAIRDSINGAVAAAGKIEKIETQFSTLLGSASAAQKQIQELTDFAASTPFQIDGLASATSQLIAFGFEQDSLTDRLSKIGDVAAGAGADIKELSTIYGQIGAAGKLTGERLLQLQERAIPIGSVLAKSLGVAESSVRDLVSQGKISFAQFEQAFNSLSGTGGVFENGAKNLSQTLEGIVSTFQDNVFNLQASVGSAFTPFIKVVLKDLTSVIQQVTTLVNENSVSIVNGFIGVARAINDYLVAPFELVYNAFRVVGNALNTFVSGYVASIGKIASTVVGLLNNIGVVSDEALLNAQNFSEASSEVFEDNFNSLNESASKLFEGTIYGKGDEYINSLQERVNQANEITSQLGQNGGQSAIESTASQIENLDSVLKRLEDTSKTVFKDGIGKSLSAGFSALGESLAEGTNGIESFGKALLASFGQTISQVGQGFILEGTARAIASYGTDPSAYGLIGAGGAMVTFGSFISAKAGGSTGTTPTSSSAGSSSVTSASTDGTSGAITGQEEVAQAGNQVNITVEGNILDRRQSGLELVEIINESINSDNVVINQSFA